VGHYALRIIWYSMVELAQWLGELTGLPVLGGGPGAEERIEQLLRMPGPPRSVIVSINSHGRGRDGLQRRYDQQLILKHAFVEQAVPAAPCTPASSRSEIGRRAHVIYLHTPELREGLRPGATALGLRGSGPRSKAEAQDGLVTHGSHREREREDIAVSRPGSLRVLACWHVVRISCTAWQQSDNLRHGERPV